MVYRGYVRNGKVELEDAPVLPEGAEVELSVVREPDGDGNGMSGRAEARHGLLSLQAELDRIWADVPESEWDKLPPDLTDQLDHYVYGTPMPLGTTSRTA